MIDEAYSYGDGEVYCYLALWMQSDFQVASLLLGGLIQLSAAALDRRSAS